MSKKLDELKMQPIQTKEQLCIELEELLERVKNKHPDSPEEIQISILALKKLNKLADIE